MEIERKFLIAVLPAQLSEYPRDEIEQGYLNTAPVLRIRKKNTSYIFTYKSSGLMTREEIEVPLTEDAYRHLIPKCDGNVITKTRYRIPEPQGYTVELDVFHGSLEGLLLAEVEFPSEEAASGFQPLEWFACEVTQESTFHNSYMSSAAPEDILSAAQKKLRNITEYARHQSSPD